MKDPELLKLITEVAQEQDSATESRDAESWDLYAQGKLDDAAFEKLMADTTDEDPELLKELYRPIDDKRVDAMVDAVLAELPVEESQSIQDSPVRRLNRACGTSSSFGNLFQLELRLSFFLL